MVLRRGCEDFWIFGLWTITLGASWIQSFVKINVYC